MKHANRTVAPFGRNGHHPAVQEPRCKCGWVGTRVTGRPAADDAYRAHREDAR